MQNPKEDTISRGNTSLPLIAIVALFVAAAALAFAGTAEPNATSHGSLTVLVMDDGVPLPGATVTLGHPRQYVKTTSELTDADGMARFPVLRPSGEYVVEVEFPGFGKRRMPDVRITAGNVTPLTVKLASELRERVAVTNRRSDAGALESTSVTTFSHEFIASRPVRGRSYRNVLTLAPGVDGSHGGGTPNTEAYDEVDENRWEAVVHRPLSTFSVDVDTASYSNVRRFLRQGQLPPPGAVRIEEMINYFAYDYGRPVAGAPFAVDVQIAEAPWRPEHRLARIGIQSARIETHERPAANLVFLLDVSGSMNPPDKLPLLQRAMKSFILSLRPDDSVAMVVYAGAAGRVLDPTPASRSAEIVEAIDRLHAGDGTAGAEGIRLAYDTARDGFVEAW